MRRISDEQRRWRLADRHRLTAVGRTDDVAQICDDVVALHSSDPATVFLSVLARMASPSIGAVERALYKDRSVLRHHAMRRTLWVMTPPVARLAHAAATAKVARSERARTEKAFAAHPDIDDAGAWLDQALAEVGDLLAEAGPLPTREIGKRLPHLVLPVLFGRGTKDPMALNAHTKLLQGAGFDGDLMRGRPTGSWNSAEYVWNVTDTWAGASISGADERSSAAALLHLWLRRFGPATETDIRWWFGWTARLTTTALADVGPEQVELGDGQIGFIDADDSRADEDPGPWVQLLPGLDPTAMGWKQRDWYLDPELTAHLFDRFGNAGPTVWVDGRIVGGWGQRPSGEIVIDVAEPLGRDHQQLLEEAKHRIEAAIGDVVVRPRFPAPAQKAIWNG